MNKSKEDQIQIQRKRKRVQCETKPDDDDDKILKSNAKPGLISCDENEHQLSQNWYSGVAEMSHLVQRKRDEHSNASTFVSGGSAEKSKKGCYADSAVDLGCIKEEVVDLTDIPVCSNKEIELEESDIVKEEPIEENQDSTLIEEHGNTLFVRLNIPDTEVAPTELRGKEDGVISANVIEINVAKEESDDEFDTETQMEIKDEPLESENQDFTKGEGVGPLKEANVSKDNSITPALDVQEERKGPRPNDYDGDVFSDSNPEEESDPEDVTYTIEEEESEESEEFLVGARGESVSNKAALGGVAGPSKSSTIRSRRAAAPVRSSRTPPSPTTSWLHTGSKSRRRGSSSSHGEDSNIPPVSPIPSVSHSPLVSPSPSPSPPPTRRRVRRPIFRTRRRRPRLRRKRPAPRDVTSADHAWQWSDGEDFVPYVFDFDPCLSGIQVLDFDEGDRESDFFNYFWNSAIVGIIVDETNRFFYFMRGAHITREHSREQQWYDVTLGEMRIFLALVMLMGIVRKANYRDYWSTDPLLHTPFFSKAMSVNRFTNILRALHFVDNLAAYATDSMTKVSKIRAVFDHIRNQCKEVFYPFRNVVIDESLVLWKGNISLRQYTPSKRHRSGWKLFVLCDCKTGFVQDFILDTGAQTDVIHNNEFGPSGSIVATLIEPYLDKDHVLYVNDYYTSPALFEYLFSRYTGACGIARKTRRNMPYIAPVLERGQTVYRKANNILAVRWRDKREVALLTTVHKPTMTLSQNIDPRTRQRILKPECYVDYNVNMRLVDKSDVMISAIDCARNTLKWYKKLFFHLLDITMLDAQILFMFKHNKKCTLPEFVVEVIRQLLEDNAVERPAPGRRTSAGDPARLTGRHFIRTIPVPPGYKKQRVQRGCFVCRHTKRAPPQRRDTRFHCRECDVPLCIEPCFEDYHKIKNF